MPNDGVGIAHQTESYRKGLVLGFTMAEIMLLVLFTMLLLIAYTLDKKEKKIVKQKYEIEKLEMKLGTLEEVRKIFEKKIAQKAKRNLTKDDFDDFFDELLLSSKKADDLSKKNNALMELQNKYEKLIGRLNKYALSKEELSGKKHEEILSQLIESAKLEQYIKDAGVSAPEVKNLITENMNLTFQVNNQKGQLKNLQRKIVREGKGEGIPPCWVSPKGKSEYIFKVIVGSDGIKIIDNKLARHAHEQSQLPLSNINYGVELVNKKFLRVTYPLYNWSVKNECRFHVQLYDATKAHEKQVYKYHRKLVESRFYIFAPLEDEYGR